MLIDDEIHELNSLATALIAHGHDCISYQNPREAVVTYTESFCELVISDIRMPEMSGIDLMLQIKKIDPEAKIILISGYILQDYSLSKSVKQAFAFLNKPLNFTKLTELIRDVENLTRVQS